MLTAEVDVRTVVDVDLDVARRRVRGSVDIWVTNVSASPIDRVYLWLYPNRLAKAPLATDDVNFYWLYPNRENPGGMTMSAVEVDVAGRSSRRVAESKWTSESHALAGRNVLWSIPLPAPANPGERIHVRANFVTTIPERYGSFGCVDGMCTLAGGFYPMVAALDVSGWNLSAPPARGAMRVTVGLRRPGSLVLFDRWTGNEAARADVSVPDAEYATLVVASKLYESTRTVDGVSVRLLSTRRPPPVRYDDKLFPYTKEDYAGAALDTVADGFKLLAEQNLGAAEGTRVTIVEAPLRFRLAEAHPGMVLLSDRFYRIWPAKRFRKFHQRQLVRAVFGLYFADRLGAAGHESDENLAITADAAASYLTDLFTLRQFKKSEFVDQILKPVSFIPSVDQLLYAPQTMFADAYFSGIVDIEPVRDHPMRFMHARPRGRLYYEKLRDLLSPVGLRTAMLEVIAEGQPLRSAAQRAYGGSLDWFFRQWSRPYPRINYRLVDFSSRRRADGRYDNEVLVARDVAAGDAHPVEPVEVLVVDEDGVKHTLRWDGAGSGKRLRYVSAAAIESVLLDPRGRLHESKFGGRVEHVDFDNKSDHGIRFVYNSFGVLLNITDLSASLAADFSLSRIQDVHNQMRFVLFTSASATFGGFATYRYHFGPEITPDRLLNRFFVELGVTRLNTSFFEDAGAEERAATRLRLDIGLRSDDHLFFFEPMHKRRLSLDAGLRITRLDAVGGGDEDYLLTGRLGAGYTWIGTPVAKHTLAGKLSADMVFGNIDVKSQLLAAGGFGGVRGYAPGALFGRALLLARAEYRHIFMHDIDWNMGHYVYVRALGGAAFADVGLLSPCSSLDVTDDSSFYASIGYGFRMLYDNFGTLPALLRFDITGRLVERDRDCLGTVSDSGPTLQIYLTFVPPF